MQCFFCKLVQMSNFGRLKSANGHILDRLFPNLRQIPKIHMAYMVGIIQELHYPPKAICSPMQCFFCKLVQISNFGPLKSANGALLDRLFPNLRQIPKLHLAYMVGIIQEQYHQKDLPSTAVLFCKVVQMYNFDRLDSANEHILEQIISKSEANTQNPSYVYGGYYIESPFPPKRFALHCSAFSINRCKYPILVG